MSSDGFGLDGFEPVWHAERLGEPWNGFVTPVVTEATVRSILETVSDGHRWEGAAVQIWPTIDLAPGDDPDPETVVAVVPGPDGLYDLGNLGWMFERR